MLAVMQRQGTDFIDAALIFRYTDNQINGQKGGCEMVSVNVQMSQRGVITIPKSLRESYGMQPGDTLTLIDLGGVFVLSPRRSEIDTIADKVAEEWAEEGETLETMLQALREERDRRGG